MPKPSSPDPYKLLGGAIRTARERKGITQQALADAIGLTRTSVCNIEVGRQRMPVHQFFDVAKLLGLDVRSLAAACARKDIERNLAKSLKDARKRLVRRKVSRIQRLKRELKRLERELP